MEDFPFDINKLREMLDKNKDFMNSFFGSNPFDDHFIRRVFQNGITVGDKDDISENTANIRNTSEKNKKNTIPMDLIQRSHEILLIFEIPGLKSKEDIKIKCVGSSLVIEGEIRRFYPLSNEDKTKFERNVGPFSKKVTLPVVFDSKRIRAKYNKGLLEVRVPILKQTNFEHIQVHFPEID